MSDIINFLALIAICTTGILLWIGFKKFDDILNKKIDGAFDEAKNDATESKNFVKMVTMTKISLLFQK